MTFQEIYDYYNSIPRGTRGRTITDHFNGLYVEDRRAYINYLRNLPDGDLEVKKLTSILRRQAVADFWTNERELISQGVGTREWTAEQMEAIYRINSDGNMSKNAGTAFQIDDNGIPIVDPQGNTSYYGHHMLDVETYPEYAGDYRNVQALDYYEHYYGAHPDHNTNIPTNWYYDPINKKYEEIDVSKIDDLNNFDYPPRVVQTKGFQSDSNMKSIYPEFDDLNHGEQLSLKYIDKTIRDGGTIDDLLETFDKTDKYGSSRFENMEVNLDDNCKIVSNQSDAAVSVTVKEGKQFKLDTDMNALTGGEYDKLTGVQKVRAKQLELNVRDVNNNGLSKFNEIPNELDDVGLYFDKDGKLSKMDVSGITGGNPIDAPKEFSYIRAGAVIYGENDYMHTTYKRVFAWSENCFTSCGDKKRVKTKRIKRQGAILDGCPLPFVSLPMKKISENAFTLSVKNVIIYKQNIMVKYGMFCDKYLRFV